MTINRTYPTFDELLTEASHSPMFRRHIEEDDITMFVLADRIHIYQGKDQDPFGTLRFGGPRSGAIWAEGQLVGEYDKDTDGQFVVVEISSGFKKPGSRRQKDPLAYLFEVLQQKHNLV
jgi:hypothetical protein